MKPNSLDDIFRAQLKDTNQIPGSIRFDKAKLHTQLEKQLKPTFNYRHALGYAALIAIILLSGFFHLQQRALIQQQQASLCEYENNLSMIQEEKRLLAVEKDVLLDSIAQARQPFTTNPAPLRTLKNLPAVVNTYEVTTLQQPIMLVEVPVIINNDSEPAQTESEKHELNLPIYYESERLAAVSNDASGRPSFRDKLRKAIN